MARVTVEDCIDKVESPYELVLVAKERATQLNSGIEPTLERDNDKHTVIALREIAEEKEQSKSQEDILAEESIYQKFTQSPGSPLTYDGFKVRMRYRLGEKGKWPLDPLIYLEYKDTPAFDHSTLETKIILARDMGSFNVALNPVLELELYGDETEIEFEYTAAFGYRLHPLLNLALETKGSADALYWGPTISHGKEDLWFGLGMLFPTSESSSPDRKLRLIIGVGL